MSSGKNNMDLEPSRVLAQRIQPVVDLILGQLTATQWAKLASGSIDKQIEGVITEMCKHMVSALCETVDEAFKHRAAKTAESPEMICEEDVQNYLGTSITDAFVTVTGSPVSGTRAQRLTDLVNKEVTERVNSPENVSSRGNKSKITRRLQLIVKYAISLLKNCKAKMSCASRSQSPNMAAERTSLAEQESVREQTPVSVIGPEDCCSVGSFIDTTTEAVKQILLKHVSDAEVKFNAGISEEEHLQIVNSINEVTDEAAREIAHYIWSNREDMGLNNDGTPRPEAQSSRSNCWNVVANKIKTLFARKFATEAIASFIVKLRTNLNCRKASLDVLIPAANKVVQDMIPENPDECTYKTMATCIDNGQHEVYSQQLGHIISENLQRDPRATKVNHVTIQNVAHKFMKMMRNWLNQQRQKLTKKNNRVDDSLEEIWGALELPQLPEDIDSTPVESAAPSSPAESGVSDDKDVSTTPVPELRSPSITHEPTVSGEGNSVTPVCDRPPSIADQDDDEYSPAEKTAELYHALVVVPVVHQCLKNTQRSVSIDDKKKIISTLKDMLSTSGIDFKSIQPTGHQMEETARAVHKDLCAKMGNKDGVVLCLLLEDSDFYKCVIESLKRQLVKPKKNAIKRFFISLFHTVSKPFQCCQCSIFD